jgi:lipoate-protein ligase A
MDSGFLLWADLAPRPGWANMAIDAALLDRAAREQERWLRLYAWDPPCLSFGRHEPAARRYRADRILELGLSTVRRPTGGRAVWHGRELTYAVAAPTAGLGSLREAYRAIHLVLRDALRALGAAAELAPDGRAARVDAGACFAAPAGGEVMVADRKVVGSAQLRRAGALLQHGAILLGDDQSTVTAVTLGAAPADGSAPLSRLLGRQVSPVEAAEAIVAAAERHWGPARDASSAAAQVLAQAAPAFERFRSPEWTWSGAGAR